MSSDNLYWFFSSSAQSISAFVALLLAGFTLVHTMMASAQQRDESLEEIHSQLISQYYWWLRVIAWLTAFAIIGSLAMVYLNPYQFLYKSEIMGVISIIDAMAVIVGILFVISIIDPDKYKKTAQRLIQDDRRSLHLAGPLVNSSNFFNIFVALERDIRTFIIANRIITESNRAPSMQLSFREMVFALRRENIIDGSMLEQLIEINKYRNLIFHGQPNEVDEAMVSKLEETSNRLMATLKRYRTRRTRKK